MNTNYAHVKQMTYQERFDLHMKNSKEDLVKMLLQCQDIIASFSGKPYYSDRNIKGEVVIQGPVTTSDRTILNG